MDEIPSAVRTATGQPPGLSANVGVTIGDVASADVSSQGPSPALEITKLIRDYHANVYRYAYHLAGNVEDAEDLTQQTFMIAQQRLAEIREPEKVESWLIVVLRSRFLKSRSRHRPVVASSLELEVDEIPAEISEDEIDRERLQQAMAQLPDDYRVVLIEFYFAEASYQQIAERLGVPIGTVMSRLSRAKSRLRALLIGAEKETDETNSSHRMLPTPR